MKSLRICVCAFLLFSFAPNAQAFVSWSNPSGTATDFNWANGGSDTGLFGSPILIGGDTFVFFPQLFRADTQNADAVVAPDGSRSDSAYDRLEFDLIVHSGQIITGLAITEYGDYGITGTGQVSVNGSLFLTNLQNFSTVTGSFLSNPSSPITSGTGAWSALAGVSGVEWGHVKVILNNNLIAICDAGGNSFIEKKINGTAIAITVVPEPATLAILGLGGLLLRRKW